MILAVHTTTTPAGLWAIVVVAVGCLAFWLIMTVGIAARNPRRGTGQAPLPPASRRPAESAEPGTAAPDTAVTRDDMPAVPQQRTDAERAQREAAAAGRRYPGGREQG